MKKQLIIIISIILSLISCETSSDCEFGGEISIAIELDVSETTKPIKNVHVYGFSASGKFNVHEYFTSKAELDAYRLSILREGYTVIVIANGGEDFVPLKDAGSEVVPGELAKLMLTDFITWLKGVEPQYPDILTGLGVDPIESNGVLTLFVKLRDGSNLRSTRSRIYINLLDDDLAPYTKRVDAHHDRVVAEVYRKGTITRVHSHTEILSEYVDLHLAPGEYDILLWVDHTPIGSAEDHHYSTSSLREIQINEEKNYVPGDESRRAYAHKMEAVVEDKPVTIHRVDMPFILTKYHIIATDVEAYKGYMAANGYPDLKDLIVTVTYEGFFPSSYDVFHGEPNSAARTVSYSTPLSNITDDTAMIGADYIFANDVNSFINATITVTDKATGVVITKISNLRIDHLRGHLTTLEFKYLTAGIVDSGVSIDTRWEGVITVYF